MSRKIGPIVESLLRRVRQEGGLAIDPDFATRMYSFCEQITNVYTKRVLTTETLTVPKEKLLFHYRTELPSAIDINSVRDNSTGRRIEKIATLKELFIYDPDGFRKVDGTRLESWCQVSHDLLILYPGLAAASSVDITYVNLLTEHTGFTASYDVASQLPSEDIEIALELAEIVLLGRLRQLSEFELKMKAFVSKYRIK